MLDTQLGRDNARVLALISRYLTESPCAVTPESLRELTQDFGLRPEEAFAALLCAWCGLDTAREEDARIYRQYLPRMLHRLRPEDYASDPYLRAVGTPEGEADGFQLEQQRYRPMELFVCDDFRMDAEGRVLPQLGWFDEGFRYPALTERGRVWMTITPNEINTLRPLAEQARGHVLCYGLGLGYYAFHASGQSEVESVTVVERSAAVIDLFQRHLLPRFPHGDKLTLVEGDAFTYAADRAPAGRYDTVLCDLWHDAADGIPMYLRMKALEVPGPRYQYWIEPTMQYYLKEAALC